MNKHRQFGLIFTSFLCAACSLHAAYGNGEAKQAVAMAGMLIFGLMSAGIILKEAK